MEDILKHVELSQIALSSTNKMFREDDLHLGDLIGSIRDKGVIQPVLLRRLKAEQVVAKGSAQYELVSGERRYKASLIVQKEDKKRTTIPAFIKELTDEEALDLQITENLHRENINPMMEAAAFEWIIKNKKVSTRALSEKIGKSIDYVEERIRLNRLHKDAQDHVRTGVLPLKAGLKLATVPVELHQKALAKCINEVEGASGKTYTFAGLSDLQRWLNWNVFNELAFADFDINDPELRPAAGSCISCTKRTKNTGGLFDDVAKKDFCLDGGCFRQKQLAQYEKVKTEVRVKFGGAEIVYRSRTHSIDQAFEKLQPTIGMHEGTEITQAEMTKKLENIHNVSKVKVAILFGLDRHDGDEHNKKFVCLSTEKKVPAGRSAAGPVASKEDRAKEQVKQQRQNKQNSLEKELKIQAMLKKASVKTIPEFIVQMLVTKFLSNEADGTDMHVFKSFGLDFQAIKFGGSKKEKLNVKVAEADMAELHDKGYFVDDNEIERVTSKLKIEQLNAMLVYAFYETAYPDQMRVIEKELKVDLKAISVKAQEETAAWWKEKQAKAKETPIKKGLSALLSKKSSKKK